MRWIVSWSLRFRFLVIAAAAAMIVLGTRQLLDMPIDVFPEFAPTRVEIQTPCQGLSTTEVEALVTVPLEQALNGVPGVEVIRSKSVPQLSSILLLFQGGTDVLLARQLVQERLATVTPTLPNWASPPFIMPPVSSMSRIMKIGLSSEKLSLIEMSQLARWTIRARLLRVPGVANVAIWGQRKQQVQVQVDPERLRRYGVSLNEILETTADALDAGLLQYSNGAVVGSGGFIETANQRLWIRHVLPISKPADLGQVLLKEVAEDEDKKDGPSTHGLRDGRNGLRLGDVAHVVEGHQPLIGDAVINDGPGILLIVEKFPWANTLDVTRGVDAALKTLQQGLPDLQIDATIFRPATFIEIAIGNLTLALGFGCLLVALVLAAFLFEWRTALISLVAIPLSLTAAGLVLWLRGATVNVMVLAGLVIAVGVVVDDAIIDIENIWRRLRQHREQRSAKSTAMIVLEASLEVRSAIVYATLIDVVALLPVFFMTGLSGSFFHPLALSYALAVMASMLVALTVTPALGLILLSRAQMRTGESPIVRWMSGGYEKALRWIIGRPRTAMVGCCAIILAGLTMMPHLGQSLFPAFKERDFLMHFLTKPGTSLPEMTRITTQASRDLRSIPGVRNFSAHIGQALFADEVVGVDFTELWISVDPKADYDKTLAAIEKTIDGYVGLNRDVLTYLKERTREVLTGSSDAVVVRIFGEDLAVLRQKADEVKQALAGIDGLVELHGELQVEVPTVEVKVDLAAAQRHGIKPGDVRRAAATLVASTEVGDLFRGGKVYDVVVWSTPQTRANLHEIRNLLIDTPGGGHVRLGDVAEVRVAPNPNVIKREGASRRIDVHANVRGRALGAVVRDVERQLGEVRFPLGYHAELLGEYTERQAAQTRMLFYGAAAIVGIFLLLQAAFGSWRLAGLCFLTLPMALVGGVAAAYMTGGVISIGSLVGFFTVMGIAARNGIMLMNHYQHLERHEGETLGPMLILRGARERLAPISMTALATGLAVVPLVAFGHIPGHEIEHPMAVVILGGLVTSTLLNLFILPALYLPLGTDVKQPALESVAMPQMTRVP